MEKLGIDYKLIIIQIINFGLLLFILKKVLYKPVLEAIKKRKEILSSIEKERLEIEKIRRETEEKQSQILSSAQKEKRELILAAKKEAEAERRRIIERANRQAKEILAGTKRLLEMKERN